MIVNPHIQHMKPKAFIISLKRAKDRREHAIAQAEKAGLDFEIVDAVDGRAFKDSDGNVDWDALRRVQPFDNSYWGCAFKPSEVAIYGSHLRVYQRMLNLDIPWAFVMEDDFKLLEAPYGLKDVAQDLNSTLERKWMHCQLHAEHLHFHRDYRCLGPFEATKTLNSVCQTCLISVAYAINASLAREILEQKREMFCPHDHLICEMSKEYFPFLQTSFPVCGSAGFASTQE